MNLKHARAEHKSGSPVGRNRFICGKPMGSYNTMVELQLMIEGNVKFIIAYALEPISIDGIVETVVSGDIAMLFSNHIWNKFPDALLFTQ